MNYSMPRPAAPEEGYNEMTRPALTFRAATADDFPAVAELGYHSFPVPQQTLAMREQSLRESRVFAIERYLVGEAGGRVVTAMNGIPFTAWVGGAPQPMLGVASVVVAPDARRYGYASELVAEGMRRARSEGATLSALYPFRHDFYAALGYAQAVEMRSWRFDPRDMPLYPERARVRRATGGDLEAAMACYERVARRSTLMIARSREWWEERSLGGGKASLAVCDGPEGQVRGYLVYYYRTFTDGRHPQLKVPEVVFEDREALRGLLGYVAALRDQFGEVVCILPPAERLDLRLANPREGGAIKGAISEMFGPRVLYGAMARVLDVERALGARPNYNRVSGRVRLEVADEQIPENRGPFDARFERGKVAVSRAGRDLPLEGVASMPVGVFTQIYLGYATASEAWQLGLLEADDAAVALLDRALAGPRATLLDYF